MELSIMLLGRFGELKDDFCGMNSLELAFVLFENFKDYRPINLISF